MQCDDCGQVYRAESDKCPCPRCGGKGTVLIDYSIHYGNRAERRRAKKAGLPMEKYVPCPDCSKKVGLYLDRRESKDEMS